MVRQVMRSRKTKGNKPHPPPPIHRALNPSIREGNQQKNQYTEFAKIHAKIEKFAHIRVQRILLQGYCSPKLENITPRGGKGNSDHSKTFRKNNEVKKQKLVTFELLNSQIYPCVQLPEKNPFFITLLPIPSPPCVVVVVSAIACIIPRVSKPSLLLTMAKPG